MPHILSLFAAFVAVAVALGVLGAGLLVPAVGAAGAAANSTVTAFEDLPSEFRASPLSQQSKIVDVNGTTIATPYDENRIIVPLRKVAPIMQKAQIAIEDSRFYEHGGLDVRGTLRALVNNVAGGETQGGSSLTQQYVKITLQEKALRNNNKDAAQAAVAETYSRKIQELKYALDLEKTLTKKQILEGYLNLVYYGDLAYGVEAASLHYFGVHASDLNLAQAATLAGTVQAPSATDPHNHPEASQKRRDVVIDRMLELGDITPKQAKKAKAKSIPSMLHLKDNQGGTCERSNQPFFCSYVMAYLKQMPQLGANVDERVRRINQGGLLIKTTLNSKFQKRIRKDLRSKVPAGDPSGVGAAASLVQPGTGKIRAMVQTSKYDPTAKQSTVAKTAVNWNVPQEYGGTAGFPFGSTAKMYAVVTALQQGIPVHGTVPSKYATTTQPAIYDPSEFKDKCKSLEPYAVRNDEAIGGSPLPFDTAISQSVNTAFASLVIDELGGCKVRKTMTKMGLRQGTGDQIQPYPSPLILGSDSTPPLTLASSYATLAAEGKYCQPNPIESITTNEGKKLDIPKKKCKQVISKDVARGATQLLKGVIAHGTGTGAQLAGGRVAAGKTGTTDNYTQSWFVGYTPQLATAVYVGTPESSKSMKNITIGGQYYSRVFGGTIAAPLWSEVMDMALHGKKKKGFHQPSTKMEYGENIPVPSVIGQSVGSARSELEKVGLRVSVAGEINSSMGQGLIASQSPSGGTAHQGDVVTVYTSTGYVPPPPPTSTYTPPPPTSTSTPSSSSTTQKPSPSSTQKPSSKSTPPPKTTKNG